MKRLVTVLSLMLTILLATMIGIVPVLTTAESATDKGVTFHFLDVNSIDKNVGGSGAAPVGSADCILIEDHGVVTLVDTGSEYLNSANKVVKYIKDLGINKIDHLFLTHPHNDHYGGVPVVVEEFDIVNAYYTNLQDWNKVRPCEVEWNTKYYFDVAIMALQEKINSDGSTVNLISPDKEGKVYQVTDDSYFTVYNCLAVVKNDYREPEFNDFSMMMKYTYKDINALFTGDVNIHYEYTLLGEVMPDGTRCAAGTAGAVAPVGEIDIFKLPHHGTQGSLSTLNFFNKINPSKTARFAVITGYVSNVGAATRGRCKDNGYALKITSGSNGSADVVINTDGTLAGTKWLDSVKFE